MARIDLEQYVYFPALRTRAAELKGIELLNEERKKNILPVFTLGRWPRATDFSRSAEKVREIMGGLPYILDLTTDSRHLAEQHRALRNPAGSFEAWREFVAKEASSAVPVVQLVPEARARDVIKQAQLLEQSFGVVAFRIKEFSTETPLVLSALSALNDASSAVVIIDCQYIRGALAAYVAATVATINRLRTEFPEILVVSMATSFPQSTVQFADPTQQRGSIDIQERELHSRIGGDAVSVYGDHASIHSVIYDDAPIMRWAARIDFPRDYDWYFERRPGNQSQEGYESAARDICRNHPEIGKSNIWGEDMILRAANGDPHAKAPGPWISVRVNIHLARQHDLSQRLRGAVDQDDFAEVS
jgi:hypothetical protein